MLLSPVVLIRHRIHFCVCGLQQLGQIPLVVIISRILPTETQQITVVNNYYCLDVQTNPQSHTNRVCVIFSPPVTLF